MSLKFTVVDAFTDKPFSGNPAAVVILPSSPVYPDATLQGIAAEMNLSETAYVITPPRVGKSDAEYQPLEEAYVLFGLRWFTPFEEFPICGHATLATASVLFADEDRVPPHIHEIRFSTLSGVLTARRILNNDDATLPPKYELEFPAGDIVPASEAMTKRATEVVIKATNPEVSVLFVGVCSNVPYKPYLLVEIDNKLPLEGMKVDSVILGTLGPELVVTTICQRPLGDDKKDFHYRVFAMPAGLVEDPVCGSATSSAVKYWAQSNVSKGRLASDSVQIRAVSRRGGELELVWDESTNTAKIRGPARVASRGEIYV